jgi:hypothetical protein
VRQPCAPSRALALTLAARAAQPENILFKDHSKDAQIKLVDFGFATKLISRKKTHMRASRCARAALPFAGPPQRSSACADEHASGHARLRRA